MNIRHLLTITLLSTSTAMAVAGPFTTYTYSGTPRWPSAPTLPASPTWPSLPSPPPSPVFSNPSWGSTSSEQNARSQAIAAQRQQELQLQMNESPELLRSQQLQGQLQLEAFRTQESNFNNQRRFQEELAAAPGKASEDQRLKQEAALRAHNDSLLRNWRKTQP